MRANMVAGALSPIGHSVRYIGIARRHAVGPGRLRYLILDRVDRPAGERADRAGRGLALSSTPRCHARPKKRAPRELPATSDAHFTRKYRFPSAPPVPAAWLARSSSSHEVRNTSLPSHLLRVWPSFISIAGFRRRPDTGRAVVCPNRRARHAAWQKARG